MKFATTYSRQNKLNFRLKKRQIYIIPLLKNPLIKFSLKTQHENSNKNFFQVHLPPLAQQIERDLHL